MGLDQRDVDGAVTTGLLAVAVMSVAAVLWQQNAGGLLGSLGWGMVVLTVALAVRRVRVAHARAVDDRLHAERRRLAEDLHDGLTQDLALIAAYGDRLSRELGAEHAVAVAARRALTVARGTMSDLAASAEPTTLGALRTVADEVESRFPVKVSVSARDAAADAAFSLEDRHQVVRIAREAMINAVRHGHAGTVSVVLGSPHSGEAILRVTDDGIGIGSEPAAPGRTGFGLPSMRLRAAALDARLVARRRVAGGTEVSVRS